MKTIHRSRMHAHRAVAVAACLALAAFAQAAAASQAIIRNVTPAVWQTSDVHWVRDVSPHNRIDDLIDNAADPTFDVVLNFRHCVDSTDVGALNGLAGPGHIQMVLKYISSVAMAGLRKGTIDSIATRVAGIAFVEKQVGFAAALDVSVPAIKVTPGFYSPGTVQDANPALTGSGVNIAIMDTGVDDAGGPGTTHQAFSATPFVGGYNAITNTFGDPDDDVGHGTHVASIALGQATANTSRGVAPAAGLVDIKVLDASHVSCATPGLWTIVTSGLQTIYDKRSDWNIRVVNMSIGQCDAGGIVASDGQDAFSQLCDLAEAMGITIVAAAGNSFPNAVLSTPAASTRAITVAASDDRNTVDRADDLVASFSSQGPRSNDGDADCLDELKPDVTAPGMNINAAAFNTLNGATSLSGTSMAAPHVAGLAALIYQARPSINPASVKDLLIRTSEQFGTPASQPGCDPIWHRRWGWGLVDAYAAITQGTATDLTFPTYPPSPPWDSPDITTTPMPLKINVPATLTVVIKNAGPAVAVGARIHFGIHVYSAATPVFHDIGTVVTTLPVGNTPVSINWTPTDVGHQCAQVEIGYSPDTDYSNNSTSRNLNVGNSPVQFTIQNTATEAPALIHFTTSFAKPDTHWVVRFTPDSTYLLSASDCPRTISVELQPHGAAIGDTQIVHVAAIAETFLGPVTLGGVSVLQVAHVTGVESLAPVTTGLDLRLLGAAPSVGRAAVRYVLPAAAPVTLDVMDVAGRVVRRLVNERQAPGEHVVKWDGRSGPGGDMPAGVYMVRLRVRNAQETVKLVLMR